MTTLGERIKERRDNKSAAPAQSGATLRAYVDEQFAAVNARLDKLENPPVT